MPGVGPLTARALRTAIDDPARFKPSVGAYAGLTPCRYASGEIDRMGRISRCGDSLMRSYLYEAANIVLTRSRGSNPRRNWGAKLAKRTGYKKARVALARKMAGVLLHRMWIDGTDFGAAKGVVV
jgi:transposase